MLKCKYTFLLSRKLNRYHVRMGRQAVAHNKGASEGKNLISCRVWQRKRRERKFSNVNFSVIPARIYFAGWLYIRKQTACVKCYEFGEMKCKMRIVGRKKKQNDSSLKWQKKNSQWERREEKKKLFSFLFVKLSEIIVDITISSFFWSLKLIFFFSSSFTQFSLLFFLSA